MRRMHQTAVDLLTLDSAPEAHETPAAAPAQAPVRWRLATRVAFRLTSLYFTLYVLTTQMLGGLLPLPIGEMPDLGATGYMKGIVSWTTVHVFRVGHPFLTVNTGSGDKTIDWVQTFCLLTVAIAGTAVWSALDRRRPNYVALHKWFRVFLRFAVASTMVGYGIVKVIPLQMGATGLTRLVEPFGNFSPMGVLWASIGASFPYERVCGAVEMTGAVLLFIPRLSLLGALVTLAASTQIFTLNMTYDVPVKLFSFHLILMSLALLAPDVRRLLRLFVLDKAVTASTLPPLVGTVRGRRVALAVQLVFAAYILGWNLHDARKSWTEYGGGAPKSPLYGIWNVDEMRVDGVVRAPRLDDWGRWRRLIFQSPAGMSFQRMNDSFQGYTNTIDMAGKTLTLSSAADKNWTARFAIEQPAADRMILDGAMDGHKVRLDVRRQDRGSFLLVSRGFNWIQDRPFNR